MRSTASDYSWNGNETIEIIPCHIAFHFTFTSHKITWEHIASDGTEPATLVSDRKSLTTKLLTLECKTKQKKQKQNKKQYKKPKTTAFEFKESVKLHVTLSWRRSLS